MDEEKELFGGPEPDESETESDWRSMGLSEETRSLGNPKQKTLAPSGPMFEPESGWGAKVKNWFRRYLWKVIIPIIAVIVLITGIIGLLNKEESPEVVIDKEKEELEFKIDEETGGLILEDKIQEAQIQETPEIIKTESSIKIKAAKGEGTTHLARRALKEYLNENPEPKLTKEHKIFVEDYLKDLKDSGFLEIDEEIEFSINDIEAAVAKSKTLSEKDLTNLSKYVPLAKGI